MTEYTPKNSHAATYLAVAGGFTVASAALAVLPLTVVATVVALVTEGGRGFLKKLGTQCRDICTDTLHYGGKDLSRVSDGFARVFKKKQSKLVIKMAEPTGKGETFPWQPKAGEFNTVSDPAAANQEFVSVELQIEPKTQPTPKP